MGIDVTGNNTWTNFATTENPVLTFGIGNYSVNLTSTNSAGTNPFTNATFINVTALVSPTFSSATTNTAGTTINITFSKAMNSPAGDQGQFNYSINGGTAQPFSAAALDSNTNIIDLTTSGTAIAYGNIVTINYTAGSVTSTDGGVLASFNNQPVTNAMVPYVVPWVNANGCWTATNGNQNLTMWNASGVNSWTVPSGLTNLSSFGGCRGWWRWRCNICIECGRRRGSR